LPDTRDPDRIVYQTRFLAWWGLWLYLAQLGSRRQLDSHLDAWGTCVLDNLNRLAGTAHTTRPVHDTLDHYVGHVGAQGFADLRTPLVRRLCRLRVLDPARLLGYLVVPVDGTGLLCWHRRHCDHCLVQRHQKTTLSLHQVLEAKLLGPAGVVLSIGSEFIDNDDAADRKGKSTQDTQQDCERKAFSRLAPRLQKDFPQAPFVLTGDRLFACGRVLAIGKDNDWSYGRTCTEGHLPAVWQEFPALLPLCPGNRLHRELSAGTRPEYRWVQDRSYVDDQGRRWHVHALQCLETSPPGGPTRYAWITPLPISAKNVEAIAQKGGRSRWKIENEGFNRHKNRGLNLEHVYRTDPEKGKAYYYLLQIAFIITQLLERGSLLRQRTAERGRGVRVVFGSLANSAPQLREAWKYCRWSEDCFDAQAAQRRRIGLDSS